MATNPASDSALVRRLFLGARSYWLHLGGILLLDLLATPLALLAPVPLKIVIDSVLGSEPLPRFVSASMPEDWLAPPVLLTFAVALLVLIAVVGQIQSLGASLMRAYTGGKMVLQFRTQLFRHAQRLSLAYHDMKGVSDTLYRVQYDTSAVEDVLINGLIPMFIAVVTIISMIYVTAQISSELALVALVVAPVILILTRLYRKPLRASWKQHKKSDHAAMSVVNEAFSGLRVVKAFSQEAREEDRYADRASESLTTKLKATVLQGSFSIGATLATTLGTAIVIYFGVRAIQADRMTVGELLIVISYLGLLYSPLRTLGERVASVQRALAGAERAFELMDRSPDVPERPNAIRLSRARGEVEFRDVSFGYTPSDLILRNVNFTIPAGRNVGIVGKTGAGKTTFLGLLMRFYDPLQGAIYLDGVDIRDYRLADLRSQFSMVLQDTILFSTTIRENIAYARAGAGDKEVTAAATSAHAHDFICGLPDGYQTLVGDRGMRLSGGERQRVALARAFLRDAPILLLDEPTSAVDIKTEAAIMEVMDELSAGRTTFMIAHRLSTLRKADMLLEVKDGRVRSCEEPSANRVPEESIPYG